MGLLEKLKGHVRKPSIRAGALTAATFCCLSLPTFAQNYDAQVGFFRQKDNMEKTSEQLNNLNVPCYRIFSEKHEGWRVIADLNAPKQSIDHFAQTTQFDDAYPVKDRFDVSVFSPRKDEDQFVYKPGTQENIDDLMSNLSDRITSDMIKTTLSGENQSKTFQISKQRFVNIMSDYIKNEYRDGYYNETNRNLPEKRASQYAAWFFDAAAEYNLDPFLIAAIPNHETYFMNINGDLNHYSYGRRNHSEGQFQMLKSTQVLTYKDMKRKGKTGLISWRPGRDLKKYPKDQPFMAAHYLKNFCMNNGKNIFEALTEYNGSPAYPPKVLEKYEQAKEFYQDRAM